MRYALLLFLFLPGCPDRNFMQKSFDAIDLFNAANAKFEDGNYEEALPMYEEALRTRPRMVEAYVRISQCHIRLGRAELGLSALERGVRVCGKNKVVALPLAREYASRGRKKEAIDLYRALVQASPELRGEMELLQGGK